MAKKEASQDLTGTGRSLEAKTEQAAAGNVEGSSVGTTMTRRKDMRVERERDEDRARERRRKGTAEFVKGNKDHPVSKSTATTTDVSTSSGSDIPESAAERKRREKALQGVDDATDTQRGRSPTRDEPEPEYQETAADRRRRLAMESGGSRHRTIDPGVEGESAAERRRREAALGVGTDGADDSDDDDTPRVPPPVAKIRFAQSPVRGKR